MNNITVIGRICNIPQLQTINGSSCCHINIVSNDKVYGKKEPVATYFQTTIWDKYAETMMPYLKKGKDIAVAGMVYMDQFKKKDGRDGCSLNIVQSSINLIDKSRDNRPPVKEVETFPDYTMTEVDIPF